MNNRLLPYRYKWIGLCLAVIGVIFAVVSNRLNLRIEIPVFAVVSTFMETRAFVFSRTNFTDEIILLLLIPGFLLLVFSRERREDGSFDEIRATAWKRAVITNSVFILASVLFIYGKTFMTIVMVNLVSVFLFYLAFFYSLKRRIKS
jgi:drug/metabolite transporter (DMT)-like permease